MFGKIIFTIHRILGTLLSFLFLMWFVSGIVMIYHRYPSASRQEKAEKFESLPAGLPSIESLKGWLPEGAAIEGMSVKRYLGLTVFEIRSGQETYRMTADSMQQIPAIDENYIHRVAALWCHAPVVRIDTMNRLDQWIPFGRLKQEFPIYKFHFADNARTQLYISSKSGEVLQCTNRSERVWAWAGAVPHWVYFTLLRQDQQLWKKTVIWLSGIGCIMVITGFIAGITVSVRSRHKGKKWFPYKKKWYYWHHVTGILFGIIALTWAFSGMMSLASPPDWFFPEYGKYSVRQVLDSETPRLESFPLDYRDVIRHYRSKVTSISWNHFYDVPFYDVQLEGNALGTSIDASSDMVKPLDISEKKVLEVVEKIHGANAKIRVRKLMEYDTYYLDRKGNLPLPVWKIEVDDADNTCYYINPANGQLRSYNNHRRAGFWMYGGLHSLRFKWLIKSNAAWTIVMWVLLLGGTALSLTGVILGVKYLVRKLRSVFRTKPTKP